MTQLDPAFLREVQRRGWQVEAATPVGCIGRCPTPGCGMRAHLKEGTSIPARVVESFMPFITLRDMAHMIDVGRQRRHQLGLSIVEVEDCAGLTADHIAKAETGRPVNIDTAISWFGALGYEIVLRPVDLPAITLRFVAAKRGALSRSARAQWARRSTRPQDEPAGRR